MVRDEEYCKYAQHDILYQNQCDYHKKILQLIRSTATLTYRHAVAQPVPSTQSLRTFSGSSGGTNPCGQVLDHDAFIFSLVVISLLESMAGDVCTDKNRGCTVLVVRESTVCVLDGYAYTPPTLVLHEPIPDVFWKSVHHNVLKSPEHSFAALVHKSLLG
jgi:hypothetical protein